MWSCDLWSCDNTDMWLVVMWSCVSYMYIWWNVLKMLGCKYSHVMWSCDLSTQRPMGLLALLDEESKFPRANDLTLAMKFHHNFSSSHHYTEPKDSGGSFIVHHYAGQVGGVNKTIIMSRYTYVLLHRSYMILKGFWRRTEIRWNPKSFSY